MLTCSLSFGRSGEAVGLSAISLLATLAKDAAPIPNALEANAEEIYLNDQSYDEKIKKDIKEHAKNWN